MEQKELTGCQQTYLDAFRVVAAFLVLFGHVFSWYRVTIFKDEQFYPYLQNVGVVMLFLLSGFLTAYSIEKKNREHSYTFKSFVYHKYLRIIRELFPALLIIIIIDKITIIVNKDSYSFYSAYNPVQFFGDLLMLHGTAVNAIPGIEIIPFGSARPLWTLSVEWWFYLLFSFVYLTISNKKTISIKKAIILLILIVMPLDYLIGGRGNGLGLVFGLGIIGYFVYNNIDPKVSPYLFVFFCLSYIVFGFICKEAYTTFSYIIIFLVFCSGLKMCGNDRNKRKRNLVLCYISQSTFMLYMLHYSIINMIWAMKCVSEIHSKILLSIIIPIAASAVCFCVFGKKDWMTAIRTKVKK